MYTTREFISTNGKLFVFFSYSSCVMFTCVVSTNRANKDEEIKAITIINYPPCKTFFSICCYLRLFTKSKVLRHFLSRVFTTKTQHSASLLSNR